MDLESALNAEIQLDTNRQTTISRNNQEEDEFPKPYVMPAEEDIYLPPGRKFYDREDLMPVEDQIELGPPTLTNETLYRQQFAIQDYAKTLRQ